MPRWVVVRHCRGQIPRRPSLRIAFATVLLGPCARADAEHSRPSGKASVTVEHVDLLALPAR